MAENTHSDDKQLTKETGDLGSPFFWPMRRKDMTDDALHKIIACYIDKILKGRQPGDLPVQVADRAELANMKTAKALGIYSHQKSY
jgi:hypothetical protein